MKKEEERRYRTEAKTLGRKRAPQGGEWWQQTITGMDNFGKWQAYTHIRENTTTHIICCLAFSKRRHGCEYLTKQHKRSKNALFF